MHQNPRPEEIRHLLSEARTVAVVGLSDRPYRTSHAIARALGIPAILDNLHHSLNPGGLTLGEALDLALPTWEARGVRPKVHLSSQDPTKRPGAHAHSIEAEDWAAFLDALGGREADVMVEAKVKELALSRLETTVV